MRGRGALCAPGVSHSVIELAPTVLDLYVGFNAHLRRLALVPPSHAECGIAHSSQNLTMIRSTQALTRLDETAWRS
jgi:hypothetical protein